MQINKNQIKKLARLLYEETTYDNSVRLQEMLFREKLIEETDDEAIELMNRIFEYYWHKNIKKQWKSSANKTEKDFK